MRAKWRALKSGCRSVLKKCLTGATVLEMDVKRPNRVLEEFHQVAATTTERRLFGRAASSLF